MFGKAKKLWKEFDEEVLSKGEQGGQNRDQEFGEHGYQSNSKGFDFKGQRVDHNLGKMGPVTSSSEKFQSL